MNIAIIVAAGSGTRSNLEQPKQFTPLLGKALILHTLKPFEECADVDRIVLVVSENGREQFAAIADVSEFPKLDAIIVGGATRAASVKNALDSLDAADDDIVTVHDGARPLVTCDEISRTLRAAAATGAACLVAEVTDTIKRVEGEIISGTVDRRTLRRALTPQAFRCDILNRAFENADLSETVTDECFLVEKLGIAITTVTGGSRNIKVTRPDDIALAELYLSKKK